MKKYVASALVSSLVFPFVASAQWTGGGTDPLWTNDNVGIGVSPSSALLTIKPPTAKGIVFGEWEENPNFNGIGLNNDLSNEGYNFVSGHGHLSVNRQLGKNLYFQEGGDDNQLLIAAGGNVGIGTTSPGAKLDIAAPTTDIIGDSSALRISSSAGTGLFNFRLKDGNRYLALDSLAYGSGGWRESFSIDRSMNIASFSGPFGIGTAAPDAKLEVVGATGKIGELNQTGVTNANILGLNFTGGNVGAPGESYALFRITSNSIHRPLMSVGSGKFLVNAIGNVGIGTTTPSKKLDVAGDIKFGGNLVSDGDICIGNCG